jgi:hypothetical protein
MHAGLVDVERFVVDAPVEVLDVLEHHGAALAATSASASPPRA